MEYKEYSDLMKRQIETQDCRERVYQDNIIRPFLKSVFVNLDIEPVDVKIVSDIHQYEQYCGTYEKKYIDKASHEEIIKRLPATPDLCIAEKWYWNNKEVDVNYKGVVEIKSPLLNPITGIEPKRYSCLTEIQRHLNAIKNTKVILTDGVTWTFYSKEKGINPAIDPICLGELVYRNTVSERNERIVARTKGNRPIIDNIKLFEDEKNFTKLREELRSFLGSM